MANHPSLSNRPSLLEGFGEQLNSDQLLRLEGLLIQAQSHLELSGEMKPGNLDQQDQAVYNRVFSVLAKFFYEIGLADEDADIAVPGKLAGIFVKIDPEEIHRKVRAYKTQATFKIDNELREYLESRKSEIRREIESEKTRLQGDLKTLATQKEAMIKAERDTPLKELRARVNVYDGEIRNQILEDLVTIETERWFAPAFDVASTIDTQGISDPDYFLTREQVNRYVQSLFSPDKNLEKFPIYPQSADAEYRAFLLRHLNETFVNRVQSAEDELDRVFGRMLDYFVDKRAPTDVSKITAEEYDAALREYLPKEAVARAITLASTMQGQLLERLKKKSDESDTTIKDTLTLLQNTLSEHYKDQRFASIHAGSVDDYVKGALGIIFPEKPILTNGSLVSEYYSGMGLVTSMDGDTINVNWIYDRNGNKRDQPSQSMKPRQEVTLFLSNFKFIETNNLRTDTLSWVSRNNAPPTDVIKGEITPQLKNRVDSILASRKTSTELINKHLDFLTGVRKYHPHLEAEMGFRRLWYDGVLKEFEKAYAPTEKK